MQTDTTLPGPYYVTAIDGPKVYRLAGPYDTHQDAASMVDEIRDIACNPSYSRDAGRAHFMYYGVSRSKDGAIHKTALGTLCEGEFDY